MTRDEIREINELIEIIEEQQQLIRLLLDTYQVETNSVKEGMLASSKRITLRTENLKRNISLIEKSS